VARLVKGRGKLKNTIPDTEVLAVFARDKYCRSDSCLWLFSVENGEIIMEVGTDNDSAYYPCFMGNFYPENLPANRVNQKAGK
jgi:hypothetical protein